MGRDKSKTISFLLLRDKSEIAFSGAPPPRRLAPGAAQQPAAGSWPWPGRVPPAARPHLELVIAQGPEVTHLHGILV